MSARERRADIWLDIFFFRRERGEIMQHTKQTFAGKHMVITILCVIGLTAAILLGCFAAVIARRIEAAEILPPAEDYTAIMVPHLEGSKSGMRGTFQNGGYGGFSLVHTVEIRKIAAAYSPEITPIHLLSEAGSERTVSDMPTDFFVGVIRCREMLYEEIKPGTPNRYDDTLPIINRYRYGFSCELMEAVYMFESDPQPSRITVEMELYHEALPQPMEVGHTYLIWGALKGYDDGSAVLEVVNPSMTAQTPFIHEDNGLHFEIEPLSESGFVVPFFSEIRTSTDEFWQSEMGRRWVEDILPKGEVQQHSLKLIGTSDMNTVLSFNRGTAYLVEGVAPEESGDPSGCIVSRALAEQNGLAVGDTLTLSLYENNRSHLYVRTYDMRFGFLEEVTLRIVGIYDTEDAPEQKHAVHPNTVFSTPKAMALAFGPYLRTYIYDPSRYDDPATFADDRYALLLAVDAEQAFRKEAKVAGYADGDFAFSDGGYTRDSEEWQEIATLLELVKKVSPTAAATVICLCILFALLILTVLCLSAKGAIEQRYEVTTPREVLFHTLFRRLGVIFLLAVVTAIGLGTVLYRYAATGWLELLAKTEQAGEILPFLTPAKGEQAAVVLIAAMLSVAVPILAKIGSIRYYHYPIRESDREEDCDDREI